MRTTKRFTPTVLERFKREGRGTGTHQEYQPWHKVSRGDPSSSGRSHLYLWRSRLRELLSDGELGCQHFVAMLGDLEDCLEQYPLDYEDGSHLLSQYGLGSPLHTYPGTKTLASELGIRHPLTSEKVRSAPWTASSDFVLIRQGANGKPLLTAVAFKPSRQALAKRARQLLSLEREYWLRRGATWLLVTPDLYHPYVDQNLKATAAWGIFGEAPKCAQSLAASIAKENSWASFSRVLSLISTRLGSQEESQNAFWKAVWSGILPLDLRIAFRPQLPLKYLTPQEFADLNPILAERSSWI
jgi:hypothetical protein